MVSVHSEFGKSKKKYHKTVLFSNLWISRLSLVSTWMGDLLGTRLLLEEVLVRPAHPVVCVGPNAPV